MDPVHFIEEAAAAGFGAVGLLLATATPRPVEHEIVGRPEIIRATNATLQSTGVRVLDVEAFTLSPRADIETYRPALEAGAELGATHISAVGTQWLGNTDFLEPAQRVELFGRLCDEAARFNLHVGVEFMLYRDIRTWDDALAIIEAAGRPNAGLIVDVLYLFRAGTQPAELAGVPANRLAYASSATRLLGLPRRPICRRRRGAHVCTWGTASSRCTTSSMCFPNTHRWSSRRQSRPKPLGRPHGAYNPLPPTPRPSFNGT
jgi:sugar phosphate isomerase/epimerase